MSSSRKKTAREMTTDEAIKRLFPKPVRDEADREVREKAEKLEKRPSTKKKGS